VEDVKRWLPPLGWAALITYFSSRTGQQLPRWEVMAHDKLLHAGEYGVFGFLLANALGLRVWWLAPLLGALFGVLDEYHQSFVPGRNGNDPGDMLADLCGATIGAFAFYMFHRLRRRVKRSA
jgi:VanZ family protein